MHTKFFTAGCEDEKFLFYSRLRKDGKSEEGELLYAPSHAPEETATMFALNIPRRNRSHIYLACASSYLLKEVQGCHNLVIVPSEEASFKIFLTK